ncbi:hypothetical protein ACHAXT_007226 [Thalassiosira profunda]
MGSIQAQTYFLERQLSIHQNLAKLQSSGGGGGKTSRDGGGVSSPSPPSPGMMRSRSSKGSNLSSSNLSAVSLHRTSSVNSIEFASRRPLLGGSNRRESDYGASSSLDNNQYPRDAQTIRFQVIVWNIGVLDVVTASVPMTFRVTLFWNDIAEQDANGEYLCYDDACSMTSAGSVNVWKMHSRNKAFLQELKDVPQRVIDVPPLAILNCSTFETIGNAEVDMLRESTRLMRWSCMYRATLIQEDLRVDQFPHDAHDLSLKLGILSHRSKGKQWDRRLWKLALATKDDAQSCTRVPYGLIVDQARLPGFSFNKDRGLDFQFCPLDHGAFDSHAEKSREECLKVSLNVLRESGYYDHNIVPLLALMNIVAVSVLTFKDSEFFYRALITLNIAFVAMGMRMTLDGHLPSVGYEIRIQRLLNEYFVVLMGLVLEAMFVYVLNVDFGVPSRVTKHLDWFTGILAVAHNVLTVWRYYGSKRRARKRLERIDGPMPSIHENYAKVLGAV